MSKIIKHGMGKSWHGTNLDNYLLKLGLVFRTRKEAMSKGEKMLEVLKDE